MHALANLATHYLFSKSNVCLCRAQHNGKLFNDDVAPLEPKHGQSKVAHFWLGVCLALANTDFCL
jgi:hypothetical protein